MTSLLFRAIKSYLTEQVCEVEISEMSKISPLISQPLRGIKYAIGEMEIGLILMLILTSLMALNLYFYTSDYL